MSRSKFIPLAVALFVLPQLALYSPQLHADDDPENEACDVIKTDCPPKYFPIIELPDGGPAQQLATHEPFLLHAECGRDKDGLHCTGWPQETGAGGHLKYEWSFESVESRIAFPASASPSRSLNCRGQGRVLATLTVSNGGYRATSSQVVDCGSGL